MKLISMRWLKKTVNYEIYIEQSLPIKKISKKTFYIIKKKC